MMQSADCLRKREYALQVLGYRTLNRYGDRVKGVVSARDLVLLKVLLLFRGKYKQ